MKTKREYFADWLGNTIGGQRLSDCFLAYPDIEAYARKKKIVTDELWDIDDPTVSAKLVSMITADAFFRVTHKKNMRAITNAVQLFHRYVKESAAKRDAEAVTKTEPPKPAAEAVSASAQAVLTVDFANSDGQSFAFTTPVYASYFGEDVSDTHWSKVYANVARCLCEDYPLAFEHMPPVFDEAASKQLTRPEKLAYNCYVELNHSATVLVRNLRTMMDICRVDYENVVIRYTQKSPSEVKPEPEPKPVTEAKPEPKPAVEAKPVVETKPEPKPVIETSSDPVIAYLQRKGIEYADYRDMMGCLWIMGGLELAETLRPLAEAGVDIQFKWLGCKISQNKPTWWIQEDTHSVRLSPDAPQEEAEITEEEPEIIGKEPEITEEEPEIIGEEPEIIEEEPEIVDEEPEVIDEEPKVIGEEPEVIDEEPEAVMPPVYTDDREAIEEPEPKTQGRGDYAAWLKHQGYLSSTIDGYLRVVSDADDFAFDRSVSAVSLFDIDDAAELQRIWEKLTKDPSFTDYRLSKNLSMTRFNKYIEFRKKTKPVPIKAEPPKPEPIKAEPPKPETVEAPKKNLRKDFIRWMQNNNYLPKDYMAYPRAIDDLEFLLKSGSLFEIADSAALDEAWAKFTASQAYSRIHSAHRHGFDTAVKHYRRFLDATEPKQPEPPMPAIMLEPIKAEPPKPAIKPEPPRPAEEVNLHDDFIKWMRDKRYVPSDYLRYADGVDKVDRLATENKLAAKSFYAISDTAELSAVWDRITAAPAFTGMHALRRQECEDGVRQYRFFLEEKNGNGSADNLREDFIQWMKDNSYAPKAYKAYAQYLDELDLLLRGKDILNGSIYTVQSSMLLRSIWRRVEGLTAYTSLEKLRKANIKKAEGVYENFLDSARPGLPKTDAPKRPEPPKPVPIKVVPPRPAIRPQPPERPLPPSTDRRRGRLEFEAWQRKNGVPEPAVPKNADCVADIGDYLLKHQLEYRSIFSIRSAARLTRILEQLSVNPDFADREARIDLLAFKKYIQFRGGDSAADSDDETLQRYATVLREDFADGYRPGSSIDRNRFKNFYRERYGADVAQSDDALSATLRKIGTLQGDRLYMRDAAQQNDLIDDILSDVAETFGKKGATCVYYSELFEKYREQLSSRLQVYDQVIMAKLLDENCYGEFARAGKYICRSDRTPNPDFEVNRLMRESQQPMSYDEIHAELWYIPVDVIRQALLRNENCASVEQHCYFYAPNLPVSAAELSELERVMHIELAQKRFLTNDMLCKLIQSRCPSVAINTENFSMRGLRNCLEILLKGKFNFERKTIVCEIGQELSVAEVYKEFCRARSRMTMDELNAFIEELGSDQDLDAVMEVMLRVSKNEFVRKDEVEFDVDATDRMLEKYIEGDYIALKDVYNFESLLPPIRAKGFVRVSWNRYVMEGYAHAISKKFRLVHKDFAVADYSGAVVRRDSAIKDFDALVTDVLVHDNSWQSKSEAMELLMQKGFIHRRQSKTLDKIYDRVRRERETLIGE